MALSPGDKPGLYEILSPIGASIRVRWQGQRHAIRPNPLRDNKVTLSPR